MVLSGCLFVPALGRNVGSSNKDGFSLCLCLGTGGHTNSHEMVSDL